MALIDDVKTVCDRLSALGWRDLLLAVTSNQLDISQATAAALETELNKQLPAIDRTAPGFEDFHPDATRAVEAGVAAKSLLYHALASPGVHPSASGAPVANPAAYPALDELDALENYIYARAGRSSADFPNAVVAVFAYQYRTGTRSPHGLYADFAYSRTGVARVGTAPANYERARRSFWVQPSNGGEETCAMAARYGAFLAIPRRLGPDDALLGGRIGVMDANRIFLAPVHKLFPGQECLAGSNLSLSFTEFHRNEKLQRVHTNGGIPAFNGFDIQSPPFVRDSVNAPGDLLALQSAGDGSVLVAPVPHARLVRTATQRNAATGRDEIVRFTVPAEDASNRFWTSHDIPPPPPGDGRAAPEYVNIRHRVTTAADGSQQVLDLNTRPESEFRGLLSSGGYEAAHFIDGTCDGCVAAAVGGLPANLGGAAQVRPAYSLVTAPDFFPLMDQLTIYEWARSLPGGINSQFSQGSPEPLVRGRTPSNPSLPRPGSSAPAFDRNDLTMTAVTGVIVSGPLTAQLQPAPPVPDASVSFLPDAASNVFAPGWDISLGRDQSGTFHTAFGLGSPFPEDAKLCAALNSFWPAAAPDATRTFGLEGPPSAQPLLDVEMGLHPRHPAVTGQGTASQPGWDGEFGPFFEQVGGATFVNYASKDRSDYVANALANQIRLTPLLNVTAEEMIRRMEALRACVRTLPPSGDMVSTTPLFLVRAEQVDDWASRPDRGDARLSGAGYLYEFAALGGNEQLISGDLRRVRRPVTARFICQTVLDGRTVTGLAFNSGGGAFQFRANP
jgi:hypothetical protein